MFQSFIGVDFWTALFVLLNTLAIFFVAKKKLFVPVKNMIDSRQKEIDDMYAAADEVKKSAEALETEYQEKLSAAQETSERLVREATARGKAREEEIIRTASREADAIRDKAIADIAREKKKAVNDAKNEISSMAMEIAGKVIGRTLNEEDRSKLVDDFIEELGDEA